MKVQIDLEEFDLAVEAHIAESNEAMEELCKQERFWNELRIERNLWLRRMKFLLRQFAEEGKIDESRI